jgi:hypothetical protein
MNLVYIIEKLLQKNWRTNKFELEAHNFKYAYIVMYIEFRNHNKGRRSKMRKQLQHLQQHKLSWKRQYPWSSCVDEVVSSETQERISMVAIAPCSTSWTTNLSSSYDNLNLMMKLINTKSTWSHYLSLVITFNFLCITNIYS